MEEHLSTEQIDAYRRQRLSPAELIRVDDHLTGCAICRRHLETALAGSAVALHAELQAVAAALADTSAGATHLTIEQMARLVDEPANRAELPFVTDHVASCAQCAHAVDDLRAFKGEGVTPNHIPTVTAVKPSFWERVRGLFWSPAPAFGWSLAALLLIVLAGWLIRSAFIQKSSAPQLANQGARLTPSPSLAPSLAPPPPAVIPTPETVPLLAQLDDGNGQITLDRQGKLTGLEASPPVYQRMVKKALTTQRLPTPDSLEGLNRRGSSLMGADEYGNQFSLLAPAGKVVFTDRPTFRWTPLGGAASYVVELYDEQFTPVTKSKALQRTGWTPPQPLARGRVYAWQVKATKEGQEVQAPKPPAMQARFRILAQPAAEEIARARRAYTSSHLTLGLLYAQAGLLDEAEQELRALRKANPDSPVVRRLLAQVQALRR